MRRQRFAAAIMAALCIAANVTVTASAYADAAPSPDPSGSVDTSTLLDPTSDSALLNLLGQQGVSYYPVSDADAALKYSDSDTTLVIDEYERPTNFDLSELTEATFRRVVILDNEPDVLNAFMPDVHFNTYANNGGASIHPGCTQPDAAAAGDISITGTPALFILNKSGNPVVGCYTVNGFPTLAYTHRGSTDVVALGSATLFENDELASAGNAALALRLFGAHPRLVWFAPNFVPDPSLSNCSGYYCDSGQSTPQPGTTTTVRPGGGGGGGGAGGSSASRPTLSSLMPSWIWWALLQLLVAVLLIAYWRGRRLGAVVTEQLPVTVRAAETVEGHARLYRRANAHGRAAELLRKATAGRLAAYFGVPAARAHADPSILVAPVAARLNVTEDLVADLLVGDAPQSEAELVLLADHLDQMEQEVRSS